MSDFNVQENPYKILGLEKGHESTDAEIKKVHFPHFPSNLFLLCSVY